MKLAAVSKALRWVDLFLVATKTRVDSILEMSMRVVLKDEPLASWQHTLAWSLIVLYARGDVIMPTRHWRPTRACKVVSPSVLVARGAGNAACTHS